MRPTNVLTERLNLRWPIFQAPMGSASTPSLAAAVTNAGGLGGLGMWNRSAEQAARCIAGFRQQSGGSLNVNYCSIRLECARCPKDCACLARPGRSKLRRHRRPRIVAPASRSGDTCRIASGAAGWVSVFYPPARAGG